MKIIFYIFLLIGFFLSHSGNCQTNILPQLLPKIHQATPEAASYNKFGNFEVSQFTGVPDISIPIFTVQVGSLQVPITLRYHPSGIKVSDVPTSVGLGWALDAGGVINRKIMGSPDELPNNYFSATSTSAFRVKNPTEIEATTGPGIEYLWNVSHGNYDVEPDLFSYSFPGHSGKFLFNQHDNFKVFKIPYSPVEISKTKLDAVNIKFSIVDEGGNTHNFDQSEWTYTSTNGNSQSAASSWMLGSISSANNQDKIDFQYSTGTTDTYTWSDYVSFNDQIQGQHYSTGVPVYGTSQTLSSTTNKTLSQILFKNGKVKFVQSSQSRGDFGGNTSLPSALQAIEIYSLNGKTGAYTLIKRVQLFQSYFGTANQRLRLDSLQFQGGTKTAFETYKFSYNNSIQLPALDSRAKDYWGYFNNKTGNTAPDGQPTMIPSQSVPFNYSNGTVGTITIGGNRADARDIDPLKMQACILQSITFPTGGYTQFTYETNKYLDAQGLSKYAGGLRIKDIKTYETTGTTPIVKTYFYGDNESGYGRANFLLDVYFFSSHQPARWAFMETDGAGQCVTYSSKIINTYFANPTNDIESFDGAPVVYKSVTEYIGDGSTNNGKTVTEFFDITDARTTSLAYGKPYFDSYHFWRGFPTKITVYKNLGSGSYQKVNEVSKVYRYFQKQWSQNGIGLIAHKKINDEQPSAYDANIGVHYSDPCQSWDGTNDIDWSLYNIVSGESKLISEANTTFNQDDPSKSLSVITTYQYDDLDHLALTNKITTNSEGETITDSYTYPYNYTTSPYNLMNTAHIWSPVISTIQKNGTSQINKDLNNFSSFTGTNYLPANKQIQIAANAIETRAYFNKYDVRANILEMQKTMDAKISAIWDYNQMLPIAEVQNANSTDIAYTSFESDGTGSWTFSGYPTLDPSAPTGRKIYTLGTSITKTGLSTVTTYTVSYWKKSGTVTVNGASGTAGRTSNGWTYYQHQIANPTSGTITVAGTSGVIDELRLYPATLAMMTTYTYDPLVGITSSCDPASHITYYEYDGFGRLILARDQDDKILKRVHYNYQGRAVSQFIFYNSVQSGTFPKNSSACSSCQVGSQVTYTVPANTYSAATLTEANQLASNDVLANGQAYADATGSCAAPSNAAITGSIADGQTHNFYFHNNCTGTNYSFSISTSSPSTVVAVSPTTSTQIPQGTYDVTFNPPAGTGIYTYKVNTITKKMNSGSITGITLSSGGAIVTITP